MKKTGLSTWCCLGKGSVDVAVHFPKNVFYNNEIAYANVEIDNSKSDLDINMVDFEVKQDVWIGGDRGLPPFIDTFDVLQNRDVTRIHAKTPGKVVKNMSLDLNHIHYVTNASKFTSRGWGTGRRSLPRSPEEIF